MHESFDVNDPNKFTRSWSHGRTRCSGRLTFKLVNEGKTDLLNSITVQ